MATSKTKSTTTKRTTTTRKTTARSTAPAAKAAAPEVAKTVEPKVVTVTEPVVAEADLRKKELIDLVVERSGVKKRDAKPAVEAALAILGEMIASGRELNLPPMGKLRINRNEEKSNGRVIVCKLRRSSNATTPPKDPLAEAAE